MTGASKTAATVVLLGGIVALLGAGLWFQHAEDKMLMQTSTRPILMGTYQFHLTAVVPVGQGDRLEEIFDQAERAARLVEKRMDQHNPASEIGRLNDAPAGQLVPLSPETLDVLSRAAVLRDQTNGAFDVTILPILRLWKRAETTGHPPLPAERAAARRASQWAYLELLDAGAVKALESVAVDLGGIAKGFAVDRAVAAMVQAGCVGGIVDIGGDLRCFGRKPSGNPWNVSVTHPFDPDHAAENPLAVLAIREGAVCTSGNYRRFYVIQGRRYSHIVDPRTAQPVDTCPSVTVVAPDATTADAWATALSVLGPEGLKRLPRGVEALMVIGEEGKHSRLATPGMNALLVPSPASP